MVIFFFTSLAQGAFLDCKIPGDERHVIKGIFNSKKLQRGEVYYHFQTRSGLKTYQTFVDYSVSSGGKTLETTDPKMALRAKIVFDGPVFDGKIRPKSQYVTASLSLAGAKIFTSEKFVCRIFRKWLQ